MTVFNHDAADKARAENPALTVFDTGQVLEPALETGTYSPGDAARTFRSQKTGLVTFTNDESTPVLTVRAQPSLTDDDTTLVLINSTGGGRFKIVVDDHEIWVGDVDELGGN
jgi:hypothetical protein